MKLPNGYGSVTKLTGKRRKPYMARITVECEYVEEKDDYVVQRKVLGYYATKAEALAALAEYARNPYSLIEAGMTVEQLWNSICETVKASDDRRKKYKRTFEKYMSGIKDMKIKDVKTKHLQQILDDCPYGYSTKSVIRTVMKHIFRYAVQNDLVDKDYTDYLHFEQEATLLEREIYTDEEVRNLWPKKDLEEYALTLVLLHQGMRIKEFKDLVPDDIDLEAGTITVRQGKNVWSRRIIPINPAVHGLVARFKEHPVTLTKSQYEYFTKKILGHRSYDVRHTFATKCHTKGIKPIVAQRIMGHKPDSILERVYTHLTIEELAEAISQITY